MDSLKRTAIGAGVTLALFALLAVSPLAQSVRQIGPGLLPFGCTNGQVPVYNTTTRVWECGEGGGGASFDQDLNTDNNVQFQEVVVTSGSDSSTAMYDTGQLFSQKSDETGPANLNLYNLAADESFQVTVFDDGHSVVASPHPVAVTNGLTAPAYAFTGSTGTIGDAASEIGSVNIHGNAGITLYTTPDVVNYFQVTSAGSFFHLPQEGGFSYPISETMGVPNYATFWGGNLVGSVSPFPYFLWYDGIGANAGIWRVNELGIVAYYNPSFDDYTPGATDYERIVTQWNSDVAEIGTEKGGTGTLRNVRFIGGDFEMQGILTATGGYKSADGSTGVTAAGCAAFKNGLCTTSVEPNAPTIASLQREIAELRELITSLLPSRPQR